MFIGAGFEAGDIRIWNQPCNWWFKDGEDFWNNMNLLVPEESRDEALRLEVARLFDAERTQMLVFDKCFILVTKP